MIISIFLGLLVFAVAVVLELLLFSMFLPSGVGWDPASLWRQSARGKLVVILALGTPILIPMAVAAAVFLYAYRRLAGPMTLPPST